MNNHTQSASGHEKDSAAARSPPAFSREEFLDPKFDPKLLKNIVKEGIIVAAGAEAILLQVASPGVGAGVNEHSNFAYRVQDRLRTTLTFVYCMAYGTPQERETVINLIHRAHEPVKGVLAADSKDAGKPYSADDADLQLWVAATLFATGVRCWERVYQPIAPGPEREEMYRQYSILACALRVQPEQWPRTEADFWRYWDDMVATVEVTDHARAVKTDLLSLAQAPWPIRMWLPFVRLATAEWLPPRVRELYGMKTSRSRRAVYRVLEKVVRATYPPLPEAVRTYPVKYYMKDMRRRLAQMPDHLISEKRAVAVVA